MIFRKDADFEAFWDLKVSGDLKVSDTILTSSLAPSNFLSWVDQDALMLRATATI